MCTSGFSGRYVSTIMRLMILCLNILNRVLKLGRIANDPESLSTVFCISPVLGLDDQLAIFYVEILAYRGTSLS